MSDRLEETERLSPDRGSLGGAFWDRRAERYAANVSSADAERDPFLRRLRRVTQPSSTVVDVGAGTGRFSLPLAAAVKHVTAVDPREGMLTVLRGEAEDAGTTNLTTVHGRWEEVECETADVVFSAAPRRVAVAVASQARGDHPLDPRSCGMRDAGWSR